MVLTATAADLDVHDLADVAGRELDVHRAGVGDVQRDLAPDLGLEARAARPRCGSCPTGSSANE